MDYKKYIYLAGTIQKGHSATEYRKRIAGVLKLYKLYVLDPLRNKYNSKKWVNYSPNEIVVRDLQDIRRAHVVLAVMLKAKNSSFGTPCEIMYAYEHGIPVIFITDEKYLTEHPWPKSLCARIYFVDSEVQDQDSALNVALDLAVEHIGNYYGEYTEEEIYNDPKLK